MKNNTTLRTFLAMALRRLHSAENLIYKQLEVGAGTAHSEKLQDAFQKHRKETSKQVERLKQMFQILGEDLDKTKIGETEGLLNKGKEVLKDLASMSFTGEGSAIKGIIQEGKEMIDHFAKNDLLDFALAVGAQVIEQNEIITYKTLIHIAEALEEDEVVNLLNESLQEEEHALEILEEISEQELKNSMAASA